MIFITASRLTKKPHVMYFRIVCIDYICTMKPLIFGFERWTDLIIIFQFPNFREYADR